MKKKSLLFKFVVLLVVCGAVVTLRCPERGFRMSHALSTDVLRRPATGNIAVLRTCACVGMVSA